MLGNLSIGQRVGIGFMLMLILLCLVVAIASIGIDYVVDSAEHLQESNKLRAELMEHEIDHLDWEDALYTFLTDSRIKKLTIPLDDNQCKFGKWLYGAHRQHIEARVPELVPLFKALEEPHHRLHQSAKRIQATFHRADRKLPNFLLEQTFTHLQWLITLGNAVSNHQMPLMNMLEIHQCPLEQWLHNKDAQQIHGHAELQHFWERLQQAHTRLHASVQQLINQPASNSTVAPTTLSVSLEQLFLTQVLPNLQDLLTHLKILKNEALHDIQMEQQSDEILRNENLPSHNLLQQRLHEIRTVVDKQMVTDEAMLLLAQRTRSLITGISLLTLLLAAFMAMRTGRDIVAPLNYLTNLLTVNAQTATSRTVKSTAIQNLLPILVMSWHKYFSVFKILYLWISRRYKRRDVRKGYLSGIKVMRSNALASATIPTNAMCALAVTDMPAEVAALALAINRYTEYQANMAAEQQRFIANVAHQLKNPLAGIYIQMDMLMDDSSQQTTEQRTRLIKLHNSIHRIGRLIHQLLSLARCSRDAIDNQAMQLVNLNDLIEENASVWFDSALPKQIDLGFEIAMVTIHGVPWLIGEMLNNLVDNAIKYTPTKGNITIRCGYRTNLQRPFLEVEDNGPGIPPSEREKVFERFYRTNGTRDSGDNSVGLGLAIVKEVTNYHNATIEIGSTNIGTTGTRFAIEFPILVV